MTKVQVTIKNVDADIFREMKAEAARQKMPVGGAVSLAMMNWLSEKRPLLPLNQLKPFKGGKKSSRLSEQVDEILYG